MTDREAEDFVAALETFIKAFIQSDASHEDAIRYVAIRKFFVKFVEVSFD